ncbi:hypothetical protein ACFV7Q_11060 [Streptomyces sp. NPDC059851]|uniref:hypothetical protein n=1 Tax=Streptomyces sp. NPDC059851 TaxID=3346971 RepID=UPI0036617502
MNTQWRSGLLKAGDGYLRGHLDPTGAWAIIPQYSWTDCFDAAGAAVARHHATSSWKYCAPTAPSSQHPTPKRSPTRKAGSSVPRTVSLP